MRNTIIDFQRTENSLFKQGGNLLNFEGHGKFALSMISNAPNLSSMYACIFIANSTMRISTLNFIESHKRNRSPKL